MPIQTPNDFQRMPVGLRPGIRPQSPLAVSASVNLADPRSQVTQPSQRPWRYQQGLNYSLALVANTPLPILGQRLEVDAIVIDVYSTAVNSVFLGYGSSVTVLSGTEIRPGLPVEMSNETERQLWELQGPLEMIAAMMATSLNLPQLGQFRAPRPVFDPSQWWLVAAQNTQVTILLFPVTPEG